MYEIELAVIGSLMMWRSDLYDSLNLISETDFSIPECQQILSQMRAQPKEADMTLILSGLTEEAKQVILKACETYAISQDSFNSYLLKLKENAKSRRIKDKLYGIVMDEQSLVNSDDLIKIADSEKNDFLLSYAKKAKESLNGFAERATLPPKVIKMGWSGIDSAVKGLRIPAVSIVGAPPSTGKTAFALNIVAHLLIDNCKMVFFSLEMSFDMIIERLFSTFNECDYSIFQNEKKTETQVKAFKSFQDILKCIDLYIFDDIYDIETQNAIISEIKPDFVAVDYIQKVSSKKKTENRRVEIEYISGQYKQIAKYNDCHIMLLSQLARTQGTPTMSSLKESGALEADGDYIMILNRPFVQNKKEYSPETTQLLIDKNKFGNAGIMQMRFDGKYQKFYEVDERYDE